MQVEQEAIILLKSARHDDNVIPLKEEKKVDNFIGIFPNAVSEKYCNKVIKYFDYIKKAQGKVVTRQEHENANLLDKDSSLFYFENELFADTPDELFLESNAVILQEFYRATWDCYNQYKQRYGILDRVATHQMSHSVHIQKYVPLQGYHAWHCEADTAYNGRRMIVVSLYLNDVKDGGETEFLYQGIRFSPEAGTLLLFPSSWTHVHRGNPPLTEKKYMVNSWLEFKE